MGLSLTSRLSEAAGKQAELFHNLPNGRVQCTACARRCQIGEGQVGFCGVRGVVGGKLYLLVYGRVMAGHIDPIEKKPVVHYRPGSKVFSIATSGCSWACAYCFAPETPVVTSEGIKTLEELYGMTDGGGEVGFPKRELLALTRDGSFRKVSKVFRHAYEGDLIRVRPFYLPEIRCTPDHKIFVYDGQSDSLKKKRADELAPNDLLAIPELRERVIAGRIDVMKLLGAQIPTIKEESSREQAWVLKEEPGLVKFEMSKSDGVPRFVEVDSELAELLGIYCAEGSVIRSKDRPNSWVVTFSFGEREHELIYRTRRLLETKFGAEVSYVHQGPETWLAVYNSPLALFFRALAGPNKYVKKVPNQILRHPSSEVIEAFLRGYVRGDGFSTGHGHQAWYGTTSVSRELTLGVWFVESRLSLLPRFYVSENDPEYVIEGRTVRRHNDYMTRVMTMTGGIPNVAATKIIHKDLYSLVPIRSISRDAYSGFVFNLEVQGEHSYCASFVAVSNCQNSDISQLRKIEGIEAPPDEIVDKAISYQCEGLAYTYNQPTIFMEYARDVGRLARSKGLFNIFVSNGYDTPETVAMMDDFLDCVTVDFKGSGETNFVRKYIAIPNADPIFQSLLEIKSRGKVHVEITDLIVPKVGDSLEAAERLCRWIYDNLGPDTPIHFLRFHPDYKMMDLPWTPVGTLEKHVAVGRKAGLNYVYIGNVTGHPDESTYCPGCKAVLIKRYGYEILEYNLDDKNRCSACGYKTPIVGPLSRSFDEDRFVSVIS